MPSGVYKHKRGYKLSIETRRKMSESRMFDKSVRWKGDNVGYSALHRWVYKVRGSPKTCIKCGSTRNVHWANKSHEYRRDPKDWSELCKKCHVRYDRKSGAWGKVARVFKNNHKK